MHPIGKQLVAHELHDFSDTYDRNRGGCQPSSHWSVVKNQQRLDFPFLRPAHADPAKQGPEIALGPSLASEVQLDR